MFVVDIADQEATIETVELDGTEGRHPSHILTKEFRDFLDNDLKEPNDI